jgi:hypothetical protein
MRQRGRISVFKNQRNAISKSACGFTRSFDSRSGLTFKNFGSGNRSRRTKVAVS